MTYFSLPVEVDVRGAVDGLRSVHGWTGTSFRQYLPGFVDQDIERFFVGDWDGDPNSIPELSKMRETPGFHRFSLGRTTGNVTLMMEVDEGRKWYVLGFVEGRRPNLPDWVPVT